MVDTRFHLSTGPVPLSALLSAIGVPDLAADRRTATLLIAGADELETAMPDQLALAADGKYGDALRATAAGAVVVTSALRDAVPATAIAIIVDRPHETFVQLLERLYPGDTRGVIAAIHGPHAAAPIVEADVQLGANVVLGPGTEIGRGTVIGPNTVIGVGVAIGRNCTIASNCTVECAYLGNNVVLHAGVRIGSEGFGWLDHGRSNRKIPQLGRVIVQDRVEIGANSTIDRGALGDTVIGEGTKIDNLVQIGHNVRIGRNCLIAALSGISGSTIIEDGVLMGGGAATKGHLTIGRGSIVSAWGGVTKSIPPGSVVAGFPAQDIKAWRREIANLRRLNREHTGHEDHH